jgi:GntR family histidine utilization transcriptional repressor
MPSDAPTTFRSAMEEILRRITLGPWGPGTLLPGEVELAQEFNCSRTTINRALREVSAMGFLDRRRKSGTRVRMAPLRQARFEIPQIRAEIEATGAVYGYTLLSREVTAAPEALRAKMGLRGKGRLLHLICLHSADQKPYQLEDRWINLAALPAAADQDFTDLGPSEWLVATVPFSEVEISFSAEAAGPLAVAHLGHMPGAPVFTAGRTTWWQGATITHVTLSFRQGHRMTTRY